MEHATKISLDSGIPDDPELKISKHLIVMLENDVHLRDRTFSNVVHHVDKQFLEEII